MKTLVRSLASCGFRGPLDRALLTRFAALVIAASLLSARPVPAQYLWPNLSVVDGSVDAIAATDSVLYIGGQFSRVGPPTGSWVRIRQSTGAPIPPYPLVAGTVNASCPDGHGGWIIGGFFSAVGGVPRANLARFDASGNLMAWNPGTDQDVYAVAVSGNTVYIGGFFSQAGGQARSDIAALDLDTGAATSWNPGANSSVNALAFGGGLLYAGGQFTVIGGQPRSHIAQLGTDGSVGSWSPNPNAPVWAIATRPVNVITNIIYFGGAFTTVAGQPRNHLAAMDDATIPSLASWNPSPDVDVFGMLRSGSTIYVTGAFTHVGGQPRNYLAALDLSGAATAWNPSPDDMVWTLAVSGSTVYAGGQFKHIGGQAHTYLAALDNVSGAANGAWDPRPNLPPKTLGVSGDTLFAGGYLTSVGGVDRQNLAAIDVASGQPTSWNPGADQPVRAMAIGGGTLYLGGGFSTAGGQPRKRLAAFDLASGALSSAWNPGAGNDVDALVVNGSTVYVAGVFTSVGDLARLHIAAIDASSGSVLAWNPGASDYVGALSVYQMQVFPFDVTVYAGGQFTSIGGQPRNYVAAIDGAGHATTWNPNPDASVFGITVQSGIRVPFTVFMAGCFTHVNGTPRNRLAAVDGTGALTAWDPNANGCANTFAFGPGVIYPAGGYTALGGQEHLYLAAVDRSSGTLTPWTADADNFVNALANTGTAGGTLYVGGDFRRIANFPHSGIAALSEAIAAVDPASPLSPGALGAAPNPFRQQVALRFTLPAPTAAEVAVYDVAGRRVRELESRRLPAGEQGLTWDGRDDDGLRVRSGLYLVRVQAGSTRLVAKILRLQ